MSPAVLYKKLCYNEDESPVYCAVIADLYDSDDHSYSEADDDVVVVVTMIMMMTVTAKKKYVKLMTI